MLKTTRKMIKRLSRIVLLMSFCTMSTMYCANETEEPTIVFQKMLEEAAAEDADMRSSIAYYFLTIPERSKHEKALKAVLADDFKDKYGMTIEEVVENMPIVKKPSRWSQYRPYFINYGVPTLVATLLGAIMYGRYSGGGAAPGRLSADQQTLIGAAQWYQSQGLPQPRRQGG